MLDSRVLALVPARGGSKGIPRKNLADLCGKPLIAWSIEVGIALVARGVVARSIVTTDDGEIAAVAREWGGDVPFMRPPALATDTANSLGYVEHALDWLEARGERFEAVLLLQPTSPQRDVDALAEAIGQFLGRENAESLISCYAEEYVSDLVMYVSDETGFLTPRNTLHNKGVRRQEHGPIMVRNGAVYLTRVDYLRRTGQLISDRPMLLEMTKLQSIDVDTPGDLRLLRKVLCG